MGICRIELVSYERLDVRSAEQRRKWKLVSHFSVFCCFFSFSVSLGESVSPRCRQVMDVSGVQGKNTINGFLKRTWNWKKLSLSCSVKWRTMWRITQEIKSPRTLNCTEQTLVILDTNMLWTFVHTRWKWFFL